MKRMTLTLVFAVLSSFGCQVMADGPIVATGAQRQQIRATPILERENRPLHFYGNTVRRVNARQTGAQFRAPVALPSAANR